MPQRGIGTLKFASSFKMHELERGGKAAETAGDAVDGRWRGCGRRGVDVDMKISGKELEVEESARAKHGVNPELAEVDDAHEEILSPAVVNGSREYCGSRRTE